MDTAALDEDLFPERFVPEAMHGLIEAEHLARYRWAAAWADSRSVLDAGCGVGYGLQMMKGGGSSALTGVDISAEAVEASRARLGQSARIEQADIAALPFEDRSFDLVLCFETIEHVTDQDAALDELRRVLRPTGMLAISSPNRDVYLQGNPHHTREYTPAELQDALGRRFGNVALAAQHPWLASLICSRDDLGSSAVERPMDALLFKIAQLALDRETFSLALASDAPLPATGALATITTPDELDAWRRRALAAEQQLGDAKRQVELLRRMASQSGELVGTARISRDEALAALASAQQRVEQRELSIERLQRMLARRNAELRRAGGGAEAAEAEE